jgi:hypothetical protein
MDRPAGTVNPAEALDEAERHDGELVAETGADHRRRTEHADGREEDGASADQVGGSATQE